MNTKRTAFVVVGALCVLTFLSLVGCSSDVVEAKELIIENASSAAITSVIVEQTIGEAKVAPDGTALAAGESRSYYLAPYADSESGISVSIYTDSDDSSIEFIYDYEVDGKNEAVTVTFDGDDLSVSGSNARELEDD